MRESSLANLRARLALAPAVTWPAGGRPGGSSVRNGSFQRLLEQSRQTQAKRPSRSRLGECAVNPLEPKNWAEMLPRNTLLYHVYKYVGYVWASLGSLGGHLGSTADSPQNKSSESILPRHMAQFAKIMCLEMSDLFPHRLKCVAQVGGFFINIYLYSVFTYTACHVLALLNIPD
jgi:hypothetical protein